MMHPVLERLFDSFSDDRNHLKMPTAKKTKATELPEQDDRFWEAFLDSTSQIQIEKPSRQFKHRNVEFDFDIDQEPKVNPENSRVESLLFSAFTEFNDLKPETLESTPRPTLDNSEPLFTLEPLTQHAEIEEYKPAIGLDTIEQMLMSYSLIDLQVLTGRVQSLLNGSVSDINRIQKGFKISKTKMTSKLADQAGYVLTKSTQVSHSRNITEEPHEDPHLGTLESEVFENLEPNAANIALLKQLHQQMSPEEIAEMNRKEAARIRAKLLASKKSADTNNTRVDGQHVSSATAASKAALYQSPQKIAESMDLDIGDLERAIRERMNGNHFNRGRGR